MSGYCFLSPEKDTPVLRKKRNHVNVYGQYSNPISNCWTLWNERNKTAHCQNSKLFVKTKLRLNLTDIEKCPNREIWFLFSGGWDWRRLAARVLGEFDVFYIHKHFFVEALQSCNKNTYLWHHLYRVNFTLLNVKCLKCLSHLWHRLK